MKRRPALVVEVVARLNRAPYLRILLVLFSFCAAASPLSAQKPPRIDTPVKAAPQVKWGDIPLSFEPNIGQEPSEVRYLARGSSYTLYLAGTEMLLSGNRQVPLRMKFVGADLTSHVMAESRQASTSNYLVGNDPSKWLTSVPNYARVRYRSAYPGIDLVYYGNDGNLEYDWVVSPSADPRSIRLRFDAADRVYVDKQGELVIKVGGTEYRQRKPVAYQDAEGKRTEVPASWFSRGKEAGFRIGTYDRGQPLTIDPVLYYATYLGGNGLDYAYGIAVDSAGNTYVTGGTGAANFPTASPMQGSLRGSVDAFVTKLNPSGSARLYSTYLGGGGPDEGRGIAVNSQGEAYVTGSAGSFDFPMMNAVQGTWGGSGDVFLTKLNAAGSGLVYSTYLGGNASDYGTAIALDPAGNAYIIGVTFSPNFPTVSPFQGGKGAQQDAFVAKINPAGSAWVYSTYLGGNNVDEGYGIAVDASGNAYMTGYTASTNFPMQSSVQGFNAGSVNAFVTKLNPAGSALVYSTYLGGTAQDYGTAIAVDGSGSAYVAGITTSENFPLASPIDSTLGSHAIDDVFITKFNPAGSALVYSTYLGGGSGDDAYAIAVDQAGNAYVTGRTNSSDFPLASPIQTTRFAFDMFVTEINAAGSAMLFSTYLGGTGSESGRGIVVDSVGNIHIAGESTSTDFPVVNALQGVNGGGAVPQDAIVLQFGNARPSSPQMSLDGPVPGAQIKQPFNTGGWAVDLGASSGVGVDAVHVWAFPVVNGVIGAGQFVNAALIGAARADVAAVFGNQFLNSGFNFLMTGLAPGQYYVGVYVHSSVTGTFNNQQFALVTILPSGPVPNPKMSLDGPQNGAAIKQPFNTGGWAVDLGAPSGVGVDAVHVWAFPVVNGVVGAGQFVNAALLGAARADVAAVFGNQFLNSGFNFLMTGLAPGQYYVGVYVHSTVTGTFNQQQFALVTIVP